LFVARVVSRSDQEPRGYVVFGLSPRLPFGAAYREYMRQLAEQIAQAQIRVDALHLRSVRENERNSLLEQAPVATALMTGPDHVFQLANVLFERVAGRGGLVVKTYLEAFPEVAGGPLPGILDRVYHSGEPFVTNEMLV